MRAVRLVGPVLAILHLSGCTFVTVGSAAGKRAAPPLEIRGTQVRTMRPGTPLILVLRSGERLEGRFAAVAQTPDAEYAECYEVARAERPGGFHLPALRDSAAIVDTEDRRLILEFLGFADLGSIWALVGDEARPRELSVANLSEIAGAEGDVILGEDLRGLLADGAIPVRAAILLRSGDEVHPARMDEIEQILIPPKRPSLLTAFAVGLAVDALLVTTLVWLVSSNATIEPAF